MRKRISKNTKIMSFASFLTDLSTEMIIPLIPFFLTTILSAPVYILGILEGLREIAAKSSGIISGIHSDKVGKRKKFIILGYGLSSIVKAFLVTAVSWVEAFSVLVLERIGKGIREPPRDSLIVASEEKNTIGAAFGFRRMLDNMGAIIGPLVAGAVLILIANHSIEESYRFVFLLALIPAFLSVVTLFFVNEKRGKGHDRGEIIFNILNLTKKHELFVIALIIFALGMFSNLFFLLRSGEYIDAVIIPIAYLAYNVFYTIFAMPAGQLADKFGPKKSIILSLLLFLVSLLGFAFFSTNTTVFLFFAIAGLFMAIFDTAPKVFLAKIVDKEYYATAIGSYEGIIGLAALPANIIAGVLWSIELFSAPAAFIFSIATTVIALILMFLARDY